MLLHSNLAFQYSIALKHPCGFQTRACFQEFQHTFWSIPSVTASNLFPKPNKNKSSSLCIIHLSSREGGKKDWGNKNHQKEAQQRRAGYISLVPFELIATALAILALVMELSFHEADNPPHEQAWLVKSFRIAANHPITLPLYWRSILSIYSYTSEHIIMTQTILVIQELDCQQRDGNKHFLLPTNPKVHPSLPLAC